MYVIATTINWWAFDELLQLRGIIDFGASGFWKLPTVLEVQYQKGRARKRVSHWEGCYLFTILSSHTMLEGRIPASGDFRFIYCFLN